MVTIHRGAAARPGERRSLTVRRSPRGLVGGEWTYGHSGRRDLLFGQVYMSYGDRLVQRAFRYSIAYLALLFGALFFDGHCRIG